MSESRGSKMPQSTWTGSSRRACTNFPEHMPQLDESALLSDPMLAAEVARDVAKGVAIEDLLDALIALLSCALPDMHPAS